MSWFFKKSRDAFCAYLQFVARFFSDSDDLWDTTIAEAAQSPCAASAD